MFCFENRGEEIGVTLHHAHGQIYGYPFPTPRTRRQLESARRHRTTATCSPTCWLPSATTSPRSTPTCCAGSKDCTDPAAARCRTWRAGTRLRCAPDRDLARLHLELFSNRRAPGKLKYLAGSQSGMDVFVTDTVPEDVTARLRGFVPDASAR